MHKDELAWLKVKVADLEDRSHHNNIKVRGISELVPQAQLAHYVQYLLKCVA